MFRGLTGSDPTSPSMETMPTRAEVLDSTLEVQRLQGRLNRLSMVTEALWLILQDSLSLSDEDLLRKVAEIDLRDGRLDGQDKELGVMHCTSCQRPVGRCQTSCLYCGESIPYDLFR